MPLPPALLLHDVINEFGFLKNLFVLKFTSWNLLNKKRKEKKKRGIKDTHTHTHTYLCWLETIDFLLQLRDLLR